MEMMENLQKIARQCGEIMLSAEDIERNITEKEGQKNFVTKYDVLVQKTLQKELLALYPEAHFYGEEDGQQDDVHSGMAFIVDPIDGTTNFIKGYRVSAVSIGVAKDGEIICGVVYDPYTDTMYHAEKGKGAYVNGKRVYVSDCSLANSMVCVGTAPYYAEYTDRTFALARALFDNALDLRRSGSAALDLCAVGCGRADLMTEWVVCPWDFAAAKCIIEEAGGIMTQIDGSPMKLDGKCSILAGGKRAHTEFFEKGLHKI